MLVDPCNFCADYPYHCAGLCRDKMKYINEVNEETPVISKSKRKRVFDNSINKNGIRREQRRWAPN